MAQWSPPSYAVAKKDNEWIPPSYATAVENKEDDEFTLNKVIDKVKGALKPAERIHPTHGPKPIQSETISKSNWDKRPDGSEKGNGFLGVFKLPNGSVASEYSIADSEKLKDEKGNYIDYPTLVPTLTKEEIQQTLDAANKGGKIPQSVKDKAEAHALERKKQGLPLFATPGEERTDLHPELSRVPGYDPNKKPEMESFLSTISGKASKFLDEHPKVRDVGRRLLTGPTAEELGGKGEVLGPGLEKVPGMEELGNKIRNAGTRTGNYWLGAAGSVVGDLVSGASVGFDPRAAGTKIPEVSATQKALDEVATHKNITKSTPQKDTVAIALTREGTPHTPANISAETGIPQPSVRRNMSELRKQGIKSAEEKTADYLKSNKPTRFNQLAQENVAAEKERTRIAQDPYEFAGESIRQPEVVHRDFGYSERDLTNQIPSPSPEDLSVRQIGPRRVEEPSVPEAIKPTEEPPIRQPEQNRFINPFEQPQLSRTSEELPIRQPNLPAEFVTPGEEASFNANRPIQKLKDPNEWMPPSYAKISEAERDAAYAKPEEPQAARTEGGKLAIGADVKSLGKVLGTSLYKGDIAPIATKELLQNSIDAVRHLGKEGKIDVILNRADNSIMVSDNGKGLTRQELESVFTDLGASGKRQDASAAGGFGLAKAAPLLGGERVEVSTVARDAEGILHEHSFSGTPDELLEGVDITHKIVPEETPTGTKVKVFVPKGSNFYDTKRFVENLTKHSPNVQGQIRLGDNYSDLKFNSEDILHPTTSVKGTSIVKLDNPSAKVELIEPKSSRRRAGSNIELHLSNNGMYQGTERYYLNEEVPNLPTELTIDVRSKVPEGHGDYPFTANREELRGTVDKQIKDYINEHIVKVGIGKRKDELVKLYNSMKEVTVGKGEFPNTFGHKIAIYDPKGQITPEEMQTITSNSAFQSLAGNIAGTLKEAMKVAGTPTWSDRLEKIGIIFEDGLHGIHIPNPGSGKSAILVNPFIAIDKMSPDEASANILHTILHEMAHVEPSAPGHNESFTVRLGDIYGKFGARRSVEAQDQILKSIADPNTGIYHPEIQEILSTYKESRGREATTNDLLSGTGVKSGSKGGREGSIPPGDKPNGERAIGSSIKKLFNSLVEAKGANLEQQGINTAERARRFAEFEKVKKEGAAGAAESLSKLKGEFEKTNPGEGLDLDLDETNMLFTTIKRSNLDTPEKARAYTAMYALLNGDRVPQKNELAVLDKVFGKYMKKVSGPGASGGYDIASGGVDSFEGIGEKLTKQKENPLTKTANTMKALMYSSDMSFGLRQGLGMIHKPEWRAAMKEQFRYLTDPEHFREAQEAIKAHPKYQQAIDSGLFLADTAGSLTSGEERFMNSYIGKIPMGAKGLYTRNIVDASERAYVGGLNKLRMDLYNNLTTLAGSLGQDVEKISPNIAKYINVFTGRGGLGQLEKIKGTMNFIFGSPRMLSSRLTALNPKFYMDLDPFTRKEAIKSLLAVAGASATMNTLGALMGGKVSMNLLSSDFMKTRFASNNVLDPSGSFQQPVVAAARMIGELNRMASGRKLAPNERTIPQIGADFLTNKLSPIMGLAHDIATAKQFTGKGNYTDRFGNKKNVLSETGKRFVSIFSQDMYDLLSKDPSFAEAVGLPPLMLLGAGEQNYPERKPGKSQLLRKLKP